MNRLVDLLPPQSKPARSPEVERLYSLVVSAPGPRSRVRRFNLLYANTVRVARTMDVEAVLNVLESDLQLYVAEVARRRLFVHAGVVDWRGRAIIIPGSTLAGKSTLVAALVRAGATFYSDEYAVLDAQGRVHPFPKPISIRAEGSTPGRKFLPDDTGVRPLPVGAVIVTRYREGARWRPRPLSPGQAVMALLAHTVSARRQPKRALTTLSKAVSEALILKGARGNAEEMVGALTSKAWKR